MVGRGRTVCCLVGGLDREVGRGAYVFDFSVDFKSATLITIALRDWSGHWCLVGEVDRACIISRVFAEC